MRMVVFMTLFITIFMNGMTAYGAEWKYAGASKLLKGEEALAYYDSQSVKYMSGGLIRVWVKAITRPQFDKIMEKENKQIVDTSAEKLVKGYYPPYVLVKPNTKFDEYVDIISWEEVGNSSASNPRLKIFFEINCKEDKIRTLSVTYYNDDGEIVSSDKTDAWSYISPDSNGETLQKILCKQKHN